MAIRTWGLLAALLLATMIPAAAVDTTFVQINTSLGNINVQLFSTEAPNTVANFLTYVNSGAYNSSIIHRSIPGFVIQGGGYTVINNQLNPVPANAAINSEAGVPNTRGTLAMALSTGPNSGTNQWFFNLVANPNLDVATYNGQSTGGPFTVFGMVADSASLAVMDAIAGVPIYNASAAPPVGLGGAFANLPLIGYDSTLGLQAQNFVYINSITPIQQSFSTWQSTNFTQDQLNDSTVSGPTVSAVGDGVTNLLKYVCNINPAAPMSTTDRAKLPTVGTTMVGGTTYVTLSYHQLLSLSGVTVGIQTSSDLQTWTTVQQPRIVQTGADFSTTGDPIFQFQVPMSGTKTYVRMILTQ